MAGSGAEAMNVSSVAGNEVVLIDSSPNQDPVVATLEITNGKRDPVVKRAPAPLRAPPRSSPLPLGSHLVFLEYKDLRPTPGIPSPNIHRVTVEDIGRPAAATTTWALEEQAFMRECNKNTPQGLGGRQLNCEATLINDLQGGGVITLALWQFSSAGRLGPFGRASVSQLIFLEPRTGRIGALELGELAKHRQQCGPKLASGISSLVRQRSDLPEDDLPSFVFPNDRGVTLVFRTASSVQVIAVEGSTVKGCRELYMPTPGALSLASSGQGFLATSRHAGFRWAPAEDTANVPKYTPPAVVCNGTFEQIGQLDGGQASPERRDKIKDVCG
jgi:hypothetical protein